MWRWLVLGGLIGCGDNLVDEPANDHSGTRLKLLFYEYAGGVREHASYGYVDTAMGIVSADGFDDVLRGEGCVELEWLDGVTRCTPGSLYGTREPFARTVYSNIDCARRLGATNGELRPYFLDGEWRDDRFFPSNLIRSGLTADTQISEFYERRDGVCIGPIASGTRLFFDLTRVVDTSELAVIDRRQLETTTRIGNLADVSDDGMQLRVGFYDHELDTACGLTTVHGLSTVCAPKAEPVQNLFADATCSQPALSTTDPKARFAEDYSFASGCSSYFRLGDLVTTPVFQRVEGACIEAVAEGSVFAIGKPITLAEVNLEPGPTDSRLAPLVARGASGTPQFGMFDTNLGAPCDFFDYLGTSEGRCTPTPWGIDDVFADSACSQPIQISRLPAGMCDYNARYGTMDFNVFREIVDVIPGAFTQTDAGECVAFGVPPGYALHALGRSVLRSELVAGHLVIDDVPNHEP